jgi:hypothetical protein
MATSTLRNSGTKKKTRVTTLVTFIMDRSGSMMQVRDDAIGGFNSYLDDLKRQQKEGKDDLDILLTYVQFDHEILTEFVGKKINSVARLSTDTYVPRGSTALCDAMGKTIQTIKDNGIQADNYLVVVLTDGKENYSKEWNNDSIGKLRTEKEKEGWTFVFLSCDPSAWDQAKQWGVSASNVLVFNKGDIKGTIDKLTKGTQRYMTERSTVDAAEVRCSKMDFFTEDEQKDAQKGR